MQSKKLFESQDRAFHEALAAVVMTQFPNSERMGCPGSATLGRIASKTISMRDPAIDHVGQCSPCFRELHEMRAGIHKKRVFAARAGSALAIVLAVIIGYFALYRPGNSAPPPAVQPNYAVAEVDLRGFSVVRGEAQPPSPATPTLQSRLLNLQIQLPIGAEEGSYELEIRKDDSQPVLVGKGEARIENYITTLRVAVDATHVARGDYRMAIRHDGFDWRYYPLMIR